MKTSELIGPALDWAVAKCEGMDAAMLNDFEDGTWLYWHRKYSTNWAQGGPIIEREWISVAAPLAPSTAPWQACLPATLPRFYEGSTPLIAAMRCYVASKLGEEVEVPDELT